MSIVPTWQSKEERGIELSKREEAAKLKYASRPLLCRLGFHRPHSGETGRGVVGRWLSIETCQTCGYRWDDNLMN